LRSKKPPWDVPKGRALKWKIERHHRLRVWKKGSEKKVGVQKDSNNRGSKSAAMQTGWGKMRNAFQGFITGEFPAWNQIVKEVPLN